jgi:hypothetical protein
MPKWIYETVEFQTVGLGASEGIGLAEIGLQPATHRGADRVNVLSLDSERELNKHLHGSAAKGSFSKERPERVRARLRAEAAGTPSKRMAGFPEFPACEIDLPSEAKADVTCRPNAQKKTLDGSQTRISHCSSFVQSKSGTGTEPVQFRTLPMAI